MLWTLLFITIKQLTEYFLKKKNNNNLIKIKMNKLLRFKNKKFNN